MSLSRRMRAETMRSIAFGSIGAGFTAIGSSYSHPISKIFINNVTDADLIFSHDGTNNHFYLPTEGMLVLDISYDGADRVFFSQGESLYVKQSGVPSTGGVYVTVYYIEE